MSEIIPDPIYGRKIDLDPGETLLASFRPDPASFWRANGILALAAGVIAGLALHFGGNPAPWVGPVAAVFAIGLRAAYLKSEVMAEEWRLTNRRLIGPGGRVAPLSSLKGARPFFGAVQLLTASGDKHLMKYQADPAATIAAIEAAKGAAR